MFIDFKKIILIFIPVFCLFLVAYWFMLFVSRPPSIVKADPSDVDISGYAWSSNFGWISFSSTTPVTYGVEIGSNWSLKGYAWSSNFGWVYFGPDDVSVAASSSAPESPREWAKINLPSGLVTGWAKVLSLGDNGWIKMSDNSVGAWNNKGVKIDLASGNFSGWAWGNNSGLGTGWISFSSTTPVTYGVTSPGLLPNPPLNLQATVVDCRTIRLNWVDNSDNEIGFEASSSLNQIDWTGPGCSALYPHTESCLNDQFLPNTPYYFRVRALGAGGFNSDWDPTSGGVMATTNAYCPPVLTVGTTNCEKVELSWTVGGGGWNHFEIWRSTSTPINFIRIEDNYMQTNYIDNNINNGSKYSYKITVRDAGLDSNIIGDPQRLDPCPKAPIWKEIKNQ